MSIKFHRHYERGVLQQRLINIGEVVTVRKRGVGTFTVVENTEKGLDCTESKLIQSNFLIRRNNDKCVR